MKNQKNIIKAFALSGIIISLVFISSCDDFLDLNPISSQSVDAFYQSEDDFEQAVNGVYNEFRSTYATQWQFGELRGDNTTMSGEGQIDDNPQMRWVDAFINLDARNSRIDHVWPNTFRTIQKANGVLTNIENADFNQEKADRFAGEALVMRAMSYFRLVRIYGGVPIVLTADVNISESYQTPRASVNDAYEVILDDLKNAIPKLPESYTGNNVGRITKGAAQTLLGQVYLTLQNFDDAATQFGEVINSGVYSLLPNYEDCFAPGSSGNNEAIWQLLYSADADQGSSFPNQFAPRNSSGILVESGSTHAMNQPSGELYNAYEDGDLRRDASIGLGFTNEEGDWIDAPYIKLYVQHPIKTGGTDCDWNIFRYAHVLLMQAEALNEVNGGPTSLAYEYVNRVRQRAKLSDLPEELSQSEFRDAVYNETRFEVAFEAHRWFDLIRTERALSVMNSKLSEDPKIIVGPWKPIEEWQLLFPIPQEIIDRSDAGVITQNPGYE